MFNYFNKCYILKKKNGIRKSGDNGFMMKMIPPTYWSSVF